MNLTDTQRKELFNKKLRILYFMLNQHHSDSRFVIISSLNAFPIVINKEFLRKVTLRNVGNLKILLLTFNEMYKKLKKMKPSSVPWKCAIKMPIHVMDLMQYI